ncbi:MAG: hypothetical protein ACYDDV_12500, partial [Methanoregula sp.]
LFNSITGDLDDKKIAGKVFESANVKNMASPPAQQSSSVASEMNNKPDNAQNTMQPSVPQLISPSQITQQSSQVSTYYQRPGKPIPLLPGSEYEPGQKIYTRIPTLMWEPASKAQYYSLTISKSPYGPENVVYSQDHITGTSITLPENVLTVGEKYRWNMYAYNTAGKSDESWTIYFNVKQ